MIRRICLVLGLYLVIAAPLLGFSDASQGEKARYAWLGGGKIGKFLWDSWIESSRRTGIGIPCFSIESQEPSPSSRTVTANETYDCAPVADDAPVVEELSNGASGKKRRTVVVMAFGRASRRVEVDLGERGVQAFALRRLSDRKAREIGIRPVSYWARAFAGPICVRGITAYDGRGLVLYDSELGSCSAK